MFPLKRSVRKPSHAVCALCGSKLNAVPKRSSGGLRKLAKTQKRPQRVFGGVLCTACTRLVLKEKTRLKSGALAEGDVDLVRSKFIKSLK